MCGNRDFLLGAGFEARTGCQLLPDPVLLECGSVRAFVSHGDPLCTADHSYQEFRSMVRDAAMAAALPASAAGDAAAAGRCCPLRQPRAYDRTREHIMDVAPDAVDAAFRIADADLMIHGHTHRPAVHTLQVDGRARTRIVLGDWYDQGSCAALDGPTAATSCAALPRRPDPRVSIESSSSRV